MFSAYSLVATAASLRFDILLAVSARFLIPSPNPFNKSGPILASSMTLSICAETPVAATGAALL